MNIFEARKLQKSLYKHSFVDYKRMRTRIIKDKLYYTVIHHVNNFRTIVLSKDLVERLSDNILSGVETNVQYIEKSDIYSYPEGMYVMEIIPIDD